MLTTICSLGTGKEAEETNLLQQLTDACLVVDALEPSVREELVRNLCNKELTSYRQIFEGAGYLIHVVLSSSPIYILLIMKLVSFVTFI